MSRLPFELFLALRYLRPKRTFVSVITLISVIGVTLGVAVLIIVISVMTGFDQQLRERILGFDAHLKVFKNGEALADYPPTMRVVRANAHVKAVAPFLMGRVLLKTQPDEGKPLTDAPWVRGIEPEFETNVSVLHSNIVAGEFNVEGRSLLVGSEIAHNLKIRVGDRLAVYAPRNLEEMERQDKKGEDVAIPADDYVVRGIFDVGYYEFNANVIVTSIENMQDLYNLEGKVHGLMVMLDDPWQADAVRRELDHALGPGYRVSVWTEENSKILNALVVEKHMMFYLLFFIMIVAAFGIMNSLITFVVQKTREIGMLKALGATRGQVLWLFLSQSLTIGVVGVLSGFGLGMLALAYRNEFLRFMNRATGLDLFPVEIYAFTELPAKIVQGDIALICGSALVICVLAGLAPAWNAGRLRPVEALRHE